MDAVASANIIALRVVLHFLIIWFCLIIEVRIIKILKNKYSKTYTKLLVGKQKKSASVIIKYLLNISENDPIDIIFLKKSYKQIFHTLNKVRI